MKSGAARQGRRGAHVGSLLVVDHACRPQHCRQPQPPPFPHTHIHMTPTPTRDVVLGALLEGVGNHGVGRLQHAAILLPAGGQEGLGGFV